ncbi:Protein serine/threonine phosphatase PrpC, regulation of stationary phase [hydrothermal vent metagenome]|uniref:Protein serine/threonine phosphatase PrpC, regulation of stationary phase n=1 Tax=hydrothermal vent metagenome TaxID=652676 RepID=A0A3B0XBZ7_9ZZZZ
MEISLYFRQAYLQTNENICQDMRINFIMDIKKTPLGHKNDQLSFAVEHASNIGMIRTNNEDNYIVAPYYGLYLVVDGLGGHEDGEIASAIAATSVVKSIKGGKTLSEAFAAAHHEILSASTLGVGTRGMGATVVALYIDKSDYQVSWVGDCRAYLWNGSLKQLTKDHTLVQMLIDQGKITALEAESHPDRNILMHSLGSPIKKNIYVETVTGKIRPEDSFLLCSDGLSNELSDRDIEKIMLIDTDISEKLDQLLSLALDRGGRDNITLILMKQNNGSDRNRH